MVVVWRMSYHSRSFQGPFLAARCMPGLWLRDVVPAALCRTGQLLVRACQAPRPATYDHSATIRSFHHDSQRRASSLQPSLSITSSPLPTKQRKNSIASHATSQMPDAKMPNARCQLLPPLCCWVLVVGRYGWTRPEHMKPVDGDLSTETWLWSLHMDSWQSI